MKSAEEQAKRYFAPMFDLNDSPFKNEYIALIKRIKADALREAAEIVNAGLNRGGREHILLARDAILTKAKELE